MVFLDLLFLGLPNDPISFFHLTGISEVEISFSISYQHRLVILFRLAHRFLPRPKTVKNQGNQRMLTLSIYTNFMYCQYHFFIQLSGSVTNSWTIRDSSSVILPSPIATCRSVEMVVRGWKETFSHRAFSRAARNS